jgi:hypothetical protein
MTNPLRLVATVGNITGIPYRVNFRGDTGLALDMTMHSDYVRFALSVPKGCVRPDSDARIDEYALSGSAQTNWSYLGAAALATSAFPVVFDSRRLERTADQLAARAVLVPGGPKTPDKMVQLTPVWELIPTLPQTGAQSAIAVDGGTMNNDPIDLAHVELTGYTAHNPQSGTEAHRAVILIDPFAGAPTLAEPPKSILDISGRIISLFLQQARYRPEEVAMARDSKIFSRFLIAPRSDTDGHSELGDTALAAGKLSGFFGFLDPRLMKHDFELGRYDAFMFLTREFRVPQANTIIASGEWTPMQIELFTRDQLYDYPGQPPEERDYVPIIPLVENMRKNPPQSPAPFTLNKLPDTLSGGIDARLDYVFGKLLGEMAQGWNWFARGVGKPAISLAWSAWGRGAIRDRILAALNEAITPQ